MRMATLVCSLAAPALFVGCTRDTITVTVEEPESPRSRAGAIASIDAAATPRTDESDGGRVDVRADARASAVTSQQLPSGLSLPFDWEPSAFDDGPPGRGHELDRFSTNVSSRSGRAPTARALVSAVSTASRRGTRAALQGGFDALGDGRFVSVVRRTNRATSYAPTLLVVVSSERNGVAQLEGAVELPTREAFDNSSETSHALLVEGRELRDFDGDGELELALAIQYGTRPGCPRGANTLDDYAIVDLSPRPSIVAMVQRRIRPDAFVTGRRERRTRWNDTNNDGHPDLVVEGEDCIFVNESRHSAGYLAGLGCVRIERQPDIAPSGALCCVRREEVATYDARIDAWHPAGSGARFPSEASTCDE